jgi:hypothetical protein
MCGPITPAVAVAIGTAIVSTGLGIGQSVMAYQQQEQAAAFSNAQAQQSYQFQMQQSNSARMFENLKKDQQEEMMRINRLMADNAYANDVAALNARLTQEFAAASQEQQKGAIAGAKARGEVVASGRLGNTVDNLVADFYRQQAQFDFATSQNLAFAGTQTQLQKQGAAAQRASRIGSQQPYIMQPVLDPLEPILQSGPGPGAAILGSLGAVVGGVSTGLSTYKNAPESWKQSKTGGGGGGNIYDVGKNYSGGTASVGGGKSYSYEGYYSRMNPGNYTGGTTASSLPGSSYNYKRG